MCKRIQFAPLGHLQITLEPSIFLELINLLRSLKDFKVEAIGKKHISVWDYLKYFHSYLLGTSDHHYFGMCRPPLMGPSMDSIIPYLNACKEVMVTLSARGTYITLHWRSNGLCFISYTFGSSRKEPILGIYSPFDICSKLTTRF